MVSSIVTAGTTETARIEMSGLDDLTVEATGSLSVSANGQSVLFNATTNGALVTNNGTIENTLTGGRAIRFETTVGSSLTAAINNAGTVQSDDDAVQIQSGAVTAGTLTINNTAGTIRSTTGQALDLAGGTGAFVANVTNAADILALANDAIRFGGTGAVLVNSGTINGGSDAGAYSAGDGVQFEDGATGTVTNNSGGAISGDRHGVNGGDGTVVTVNNNGTGTITGRNGSGIGLDGSGSVTNFGTITGAFSNSPGSDTSGLNGLPDGTPDGDGDGIDIDGRAVVVNRGIIQGTGAGGNGSDGLANTSEGIAAGGGSFTNHAGASITGAGLGILIDDSSQGDAPFVTTIVNDGTITGGTSYGIRIISSHADAITNSGTIAGGGGTAIRFGNGNNTLVIKAGSAIIGVTNGEGGSNTLNYSLLGVAGATVNFATGAATGTGGVVNFHSVVGSAGIDIFTGNDLANTLTGNAGNDILSGGGGTDVLAGGAGNDKLDGGAGTNSVNGAAGQDIFVASRSSTAASATTITDFGSRYFAATLDGTSQHPGVPTAATGAAAFVLNRSQTVLTASTTTTGVDFGGGGQNGVTDFHLHNAEEETNGPVVWNIETDAQTTVNANTESFTSVWTSAEGLTAQLTNLLTGKLYENIHTNGHPGGEIRGQVLAVAGDTGADKIDLTVLNIGSLSTFQALASDVAGSARLTTVFNGFTSMLTIGGVLEASLTAADFIFAGNVAQTISGNAGADDLFGGGGNDTLNGLGGNDRLYGESNNDTLNGGEGDDTLIGGLGTDALRGGNGNDTYILDDALDTIIDGGGTADLAISSVTLTAWSSAGVENLTLLGGNIDGTGNGLANIITGTAGRNVLYGSGGNDTLNGLAGNDTLRGNTGVDILNGGDGDDYLSGDEHYSHAAPRGADTLRGGLGNDFYELGDEATGVDTVIDTGGTDIIFSDISRSLLTFVTIENLSLQSGGHVSGTGNNLANIIIGSSGNNILDGGGGTDTLRGLTGNDTYVLGSSNDIVEDLAGTDLVTSTISRSLMAAGLTNIENLTLLSGNINGTGNNLANIITGSTGNNILDGGAAADTLRGLTGNDTYVLGGTTNDVVQDTGGAADLVTSTITRSLLTAGLTTIENLTLLGGAVANGTGNNLANVITGNAAANTLDGQAGNDTLLGLAGNDVLIGNAGKDTSTGGAGNDVFRFAAATHSPVGANADIILDFDDSGDDRIDLSAVFGGTLAYRHNLAFTAAGQVRINDIAGADVLVEVNTAGTLAADMQIRLAGTTLASMAPADFVL